jgi:DinB superfamily
VSIVSHADPLREHVVDSLRRTIERRFDQAVADFPADAINTRAPNLDYTFWGLLEHLRIGQWDIVEYVLNPKHVSPHHPVEYWPKPDDDADAAAWQRSIDAFHADARRFIEHVADPRTDLMAPMPHTPGHTVLREVSLLVGHSSYHLGEFGILRQVMQNWPPGHQ